jgi:hypothetical protein
MSGAAAHSGAAMLAAQSEFGRLASLPVHDGQEVREMPDPNSTSYKREAERARRVERLVHEGASRLTAERIVAIERGAERVGRARRHTTSHR